MDKARNLNFKIIFTVLISVIFAVLLLSLLPIFLKNTFFLLMLPVAGLFFVFLVAKPKEVLMLVFLARPFLDTFLDLTKISLGVTQFSAGAILNFTIIFLAIFLSFYLKSFPKKDSLKTWWVVFLVVLIISTTYSHYKGFAVRLLINQFSYFAMYLLPFLVIRTELDFKNWFKILILSFVVPVIWGNLDLLIFGGKYFPDSGQRITGCFTHPNIFAFYLVLGLTIYFYFLKSKIFVLRPKIKFGLIALMINMFILLIATKTRNAWVSFFIVSFVYGLLRDKKVLFIILLSIPLLMLIPSFQNRVMDVISAPKAGGYDGLNSFEWRLEMWKSSISTIKERPLQGYGLASFKPMSGKFSNVGRNMGAHNVYLELLFEAGLFGVVSFICLLLFPLIAFYKRMNISKDVRESQLYALLVGYLTGYVVICTSDNLLYYLAFNWYVWFFIGLMFVQIKIYKNKSS